MPGLPQRGDHGFIVEQVQRDSGARMFAGPQEKILGRIRAHAHGQIGLHRAHIRKRVQGDIAQGVGGVRAVRAHAAQGHILRGLALGTLAAGDECFLKNVPDFIGFDVEQAQQFARRIRCDAPGLQVRFVKRIKELVDAAQGNGIASGFDL